MLNTRDGDQKPKEISRPFSVTTLVTEGTVRKSFQAFPVSRRNYLEADCNYKLNFLILNVS